MSRHIISVAVNGKNYKSMVESRTTLLDFLRTQLNLTGTHLGCEHGVCGACSIIYEGAPVRSCSLLAVQANDKQITTVEGLCNSDGSPSILQDAFCEAHAMQCGYCTPGMLMRSYRFLQENPAPSEVEIREGLSGNLCRCTGYQNIVKAVKSAAVKLQNKETTEA